MMRRPADSACGPRRWPHGDWPTRAGRWHGDRRRFVRRAAFAGLLVMMLSVTGAVTLAWLTATSIGLVGPRPPGATWALVLAGIASAGVAVVALVAVVRRFVLPLGGIMEAADRVAGGSYDTRVAEQGPPPIRALARAFNTMTGRLRDNDRLRRDLMADIAHELRTPLTVMHGKLEGILDGVYPRDDAQIQLVLDETRVLSRLVEDLRTLALSESGALKLQRDPTEVGALARDAIRAFADAAASSRVTLDVDVAPGVPVIEIDPVRIREVIGNLVSNALRHTPAGGRVTVRVTPAPAGGAAVEVQDTGSGMTPDDLAHAVDRFYKGAQSRGSGLGLTIARSLVAVHGGAIRASAAPGGGTLIRFDLPGEK